VERSAGLPDRRDSTRRARSSGCGAPDAAPTWASCPARISAGCCRIGPEPDCGGKRTFVRRRRWVWSSREAGAAPKTPSASLFRLRLAHDSCARCRGRHIEFELARLRRDARREFRLPRNPVYSGPLSRALDSQHGPLRGLASRDSARGIPHLVESDTRRTARPVCRSSVAAKRRGARWCATVCLQAERRTLGAL
jgi:hypothetical protein